MDIITNTIQIKGLSDITKLTEVILNSLVRHQENGEVILPTEDEKWDIIRSVRDDLLQQCDWVIIKALEDGVSESQEWKDYREALRNIPQTFQTPEEVIFPTKP